MITREQVIEMAAKEFDILEPNEYHDEHEIVDSGNHWITRRIENLVHAAYKRGVEDAINVVMNAGFRSTGVPAYESIAIKIRKLLEDTCTTS